VKDGNHVQYFTCLFDPDDHFSGSSLYGCHFTTTLSDGYLPCGSIWFRRPIGDIVIVRNVERIVRGNGTDRQVLKACPPSLLRNLPLSSRRLMRQCQQDKDSSSLPTL
jgi:hypothetical protein